MPNFVDDSTTLAFPKTDLTALGIGDPTKYVVAADWNAVCQALYDLRAHLLGGPGTANENNVGDITANTNDATWLPLATTQVVKLTMNGGGFSVTGVAGGTHGRLLRIIHVGASGTCSLVHESASSAAANRFRNQAFASRSILGTGVTYIYDGTLSRWVEL